MVANQKPVLENPPKPRSGKELLLSSKEFAVENRSKSWYHTLTTLLYLILAFAGTYTHFHWTIDLFFSVISGLLIVKFFIIYHDYLHRAILQDSICAKAIMTLFGIFVLAPTTIWERTHNHHHNHNSKLTHGGIGSYPLVSKLKFKQLTAKERFIYLAARHPLTILFGYITLFSFDFNVKSIIKNPKIHWDSLVAIVLHIGISVAIFQYLGWYSYVVSWLIPFVIAHAMGSYLFYAQHNFPGAVFVDNKDWNYAEAAISSTSFLVMGPIMSWFTGNIGYHHVHHINHRIPFYRLKEAMENMPELQHPKTITLHPKDIIACLRLKVWDSDINKMTSL